MRILSTLVVAVLFAAVSCHVTVFRDGRWQVVPGRRSDMGDWGRFGPRSMPFGPMTGMGRFGSEYPGEFQSPWNNGNIMWNSGFPQIPAVDPTIPTQWINNGIGNQQTLSSDPWAQYNFLQNSANPLNQGTNDINAVPDINSINSISTNPNVNAPWNTLNNPALGPNTGSQLPLFPNNAVPGLFGQFQSNPGSPFNNQFQGNPNNGAIGQFQSTSGLVGSPFNNQFLGNTNNGGAIGQFGQFPSNPNTIGSPLNQLQGNPNNGVSFIGSSGSIGKRK